MEKNERVSNQRWVPLSPPISPALHSHHTYYQQPQPPPSPLPRHPNKLHRAQPPLEPSNTGSSRSQTPRASVPSTPLSSPVPLPDTFQSQSPTPLFQHSMKNRINTPPHPRLLVPTDLASRGQDRRCNLRWRDNGRSIVLLKLCLEIRSIPRVSRGVRKFG